MYGDYDNVTKDANALMDILNRQGTGIALEVLADFLANTSHNSKLTEEENNHMMANVCRELSDLFSERT